MKDRVLIVEDNRALAKLIAKKMENNIEMSIDVAHTLAEASEFLKFPEKYFITLLDLNLPDAPNGEIVDFVISKGLPVIVLTGSIDEQTKNTFIHKDIIDYVYKGNMDDINYIFKTINRLSKNREYKVMVIEDSVAFRNNIKKILKNLQFKDVFVAAHGEEAMKYFNDNDDIKFVISDYFMPVKDGLEVLKDLRKHKDKNQLGILMMTSPNENVNAAAFLKNGANDFIAKPFEKEELVCRVNNTIEAIENINQIANFANHDFLTGAKNRRCFYAEIDDYFDHIEHNPESYAVAMLDIDYFKRINDTYGHDAGDEVLKFLARKLMDKTKGNDIVARFGGEEFCVILKDVEQKNAIKFFVNLRSDIASSRVAVKDNTLNFTISIGLTFADNKEDIHELLEKADTALYDAKNNGRNRIEICQ